MRERKLKLGKNKKNFHQKDKNLKNKQKKPE